jgi:hypothetical protein
MYAAAALSGIFADVTGGGKSLWHSANDEHRYYTVEVCAKLADLMLAEEKKRIL